MGTYIGLALTLMVAAYALANGVYALVAPAKWLHARWTATRSVDKNDPNCLPAQPWFIRFFGVMCTVSGVFLLWIICRGLMKAIAG
jgi:hypothetical protein